MHQSIDLTTEP